MLLAVKMAPLFFGSNCMSYHFLILTLILVTILGCTPVPPILVENSKNQVVILLHGLARTHRSMQELGNYLGQQGKFKIINVDYPSRQLSMPELVNYLDQQLGQFELSTVDKIHFVTHSLGGILIRFYLKQHSLPNLGRVVMISPPNQGSELVDFLGDNCLFAYVMGPVAPQLGTDPDSLPNQLGSVQFPLGIITGNFSLNPLASLIIPGQDDGTVAVERAKVSGMTAFIVLPYGHSFLMNQPAIMKQTLQFLEYGRFLENGPEF